MGWWAMYWVYVAIPAVAAIAISVYAGKRAQLIAFSFLLLAVDAVVLLSIELPLPEPNFRSFLQARPAIYVAGFWAFVGAVVALVNGLSAGRDARSGLEAGRWVVIGVSAVLLLTGPLPLHNLYGTEGPELWFVDPLWGRWWWLSVAIPAVTAIAVSACAKKRAQLVASGLLLLTLYTTVRLTVFNAQSVGFGFVEFLRAYPALYVVAVLALVGAVVALINGLSAKRE